MIDSPTMLFVGQLFRGSTANQRRDALEEIGFRVESINTIPAEEVSTVSVLLSRIGARLFRLGLDRFGPLDLANARTTIISSFESHSYDVLWLDKGVTISANCLATVRLLRPECRIIGYSPDDMAGRHNQTRHFLESLPYYDLFLTTKSYGVQELRVLGCSHVKFVNNAYDPATHRSVELSPDERKRLGGPVGFIGAWEPERARSLDRLAQSGIPVRVWGTGWEKCTHRHPNLIREKRAQWGEDYAKTICAFDINLCFLRKINRDRQTTRSVEIPACGAFMLAERTEEHAALFEEGREADFFESDEELIEKVHFYLQHEEKRHSIGRAGLERCRRDGYSYASRLRLEIEHFMQGRR